jgi:hypothetical protein
LGQCGNGELLLVAQDRAYSTQDPIGRVTKPRLTCSITSSASTMPNADTRQSATEAPWSSRCRRV